MILIEEEAYNLTDHFHTVRLTDEDYLKFRSPKERSERLLKNAEEMTKHMLNSGYDGLVVIQKHGTLEIVDYRPYKTRS